MTKQKLIDTVHKIVLMSKDQLEIFAREVSTSQVDEKARYFLNRAIDLRFEEFDNVSAIAAESELALFEYEDEY